MQTQLLLLKYPPPPLLSPGFKMQISDVSTFPRRLPHRYDSEYPLPSPKPAGKQKTHTKPILQSVIKGWEAGKICTRQKLISCVSPSPLAV